MNALIVVNSTDQDQELGVAFEAAMKERKWDILEDIPFSYFKKFDSSTQDDEIIELAKDDVEYSTVEAEWKKVKYLLLITEKTPNEFVTK